MIDKAKQDTLRRFLFEPHPIRGEWVHLDTTWKAVLEREEYPEEIRLVLGKALAAAALLTSTLKLDGRLTLQVVGGEILKILVVQCTSDLELRALARWEGDPTECDFRDLVGDGQLSITLERNDEPHRYQGVVPIEGDSLTDSLQAYFRNSEQLPTRLWLASDEHSAVGMLLQKLPADDSDSKEEHDEDAWPRVQALGDSVSEEDLLQWSDNELVHKLFHQEDVRVFAPQPVSFHCSCDRERIGLVLKSFPKDELRELLQDDVIEVRCEFCNKLYHFNTTDVERLIAERDYDHGSEAIH